MNVTSKLQRWLITMADGKRYIVYAGTEEAARQLAYFDSPADNYVVEAKMAGHWDTETNMVRGGDDEPPTTCEENWWPRKETNGVHR